MVLSRREGGRGKEEGKSREKSQRGRSGAGSAGSTLVPDQHCQAACLPQGPHQHVRAIEALLGCQESPQQNWGCQCYTFFFFSGDRDSVGKGVKINYCV